MPVGRDDGLRPTGTRRHAFTNSWPVRSRAPVGAVPADAEDRLGIGLDDSVVRLSRDRLVTCHVAPFRV